MPLTSLVDSIVETTMNVHNYSDDKDNFQTCLLKGQIKTVSRPLHAQKG